MKWHLVFLAVIILSVALRAPIPWTGHGLWWDEVVYVGLARSLERGYYSLDPSLPIESFRPPLTPAIMAPFHSDLDALKIVFFLFSILSLIAVYKLSLHYGKQEALLTTLFVSTSSFFVFYATKLLTESLFILFLSLSLLSFLRWEKTQKRKDILFAGAFAGLSFLVRYFATILLFSFIILFLVHLIQKKSAKQIPLFFIAFFLVLTPWFLLSQINYGNPIESYVVNIGVYAVSVPQTFWEGLGGLALVWSYLTIFIAAFFMFHKKEFKHVPLIALFILTIGIYLAIPHKESRYLLSFLPVYALLASLGLSKIASLSPKIKGVVFSAIVVFSLATLLFSVNLAVEDVRSSALVEAARYLREISHPNDIILTQSYPFVFTLSERKAVPYCDFENQSSFDQCQGEILNSGFPLEELKNTLEKYPIKYILSYKFEPANPKEARDFFDQHFEKIRVFEQWGDPEAVVVYSVREKAL